MAHLESPPAPGSLWTARDLYERFGPIPLARVRFDPPPGTAREEHVVSIRDREDRLYELVDGVLVEKDLGYYESFLAGLLVRRLGNFAETADLGFVLPPDGMARLAPGLIRIPDVSFVSWRRLPGREIPREPVPALPPDLAIEVLSRGNTAQEMERKLHDYFRSGVQVVWYVDPARREVRVYSAADRSTVVREDETLHGEPLLPGFTLPLRELFSQPRGPA